MAETNKFPKNDKFPKEEKAGSLLTLGRIPPQAKDMEQAVLGALLLEKNALHRVTDLLKVEMFYEERHKVIFDAVLGLFQNSDPIDILTVKDFLRKKGQLEQAGGAYYLAELTSRVASAANIEYHSRVIAEKYILRQLISVSDNVIKDAYDETTDVFDLLDKTEQNLFEISETHLRRNYMGMTELVMLTLKKLEELKDKGEGMTGIPSGFTELDKLTSGWQKTDLVIVAARPAMGKCLGKGTKILMFDGTLKKVEDIRVGDLLMGDDSTPRKVLSLARGRENMYWVRQNRGIDYRVNESHILSLRKQEEVLDIELKKYISSSDTFKRNYKGYKVAVEFEEKSLPIDPYFVGIWMCWNDTCWSHCGINLRGAFPKEIEDYLTFFAKENQYKVEKQYAFFDFCPHSQGSQATMPLMTILQKEGLHIGRRVLNPGKYTIIYIPEKYLHASKENRLALLAGIIDAEGKYLKGKNAYKIYSPFVEDYIHQVKFLADTLGFQTELVKEKNRHLTSLSIYGDIATIPVKVAGKKAISISTKNNIGTTKISVEFDKEDEYFGFEIDGNRRFLLEDCTVTHNTAFTLTVARNAAVGKGTPVAFFSLEMAAVQLTQRLICSEAELDAQKVRNGKLENYEWTQLISRIGTLSNAPIYIDDTPGISIMDLRAKCRRLKAEKKIEMVIIDYLQLMTGSSTKGGNREQEIAGISRALKEIAKELDVCVIALSQLSRAVETRGGDKKPQLSDLRESGCLAGDSLITDAETGRLVTIKSLAERQQQTPFSCLGVDAALNIAPRNLVKAFYSGKKQVFELETVTGKKIKASANHPFLTIDGWKRLDALRIGEKIATPRKITVENPSNPISEKELILLAHLIGDGCILPKSPYHYTSADMQNIEIVNECAKELFGIEAKIIQQKNWWHTYLKTPYHLTHKVKHPITIWYEKLGLERVRSYDKKLPDSIFECDDARIALFLKHLWATDGNISWKNTKQQKDAAIYYASNSYQLIQQVQYLLLRLGIIAKIYKTQKGTYRPTYQLWVEGGASRHLLFLEMVGCYGERGAKIPQMIELLQKINTNSTDIIPKEAWQTLIEPMMKNSDVSWEALNNHLWLTDKGNRVANSDISRTKMSKIAEVLQSPVLKNLAESDIYWEDIKSITPLEIEDVYDVTVDKVHNFISNNMVTHNSIEQDADMVMALYRPEYYGFETDEEGNSTAGVAQVIILKQRNGPTGEAKMQFIGKYGKFADANAYSNTGLTIGSALNTNTPDTSVKSYFDGAGNTPNITIPSKMNEDLSGNTDDVPF